MMAEQIDGKIFVCPSAPDDIAAGKTFMNIKFSDVEKNPSLGDLTFPWYGLANTLGMSGPGPSYVPINKQTSLKNPSSLMLIGDVYTPCAGPTYLYGYYLMGPSFTPSPSATGNLDARHNKSVNILFNDSHASGITSQCKLTRNTYSATNNPYSFEPFSPNNSTNAFWYP